MAVNPVFSSPVGGGIAPGASSQSHGVQGFVDTLKKAVASVDERLKAADKAAQDLATGRTHALHETMIAMEEAEISFRLLMAVRAKLLAAYQEIMRMQV